MKTNNRWPFSINHFPRLVLLGLCCAYFWLFIPAHAEPNDLAYYLPPGETQALNWAVEGSDTIEQYLLLHQENQRPFNKGTVVLIPNWGLHPYQSSIIKTLYQALPQYGWESYALHPPTQDIQSFQWQLPSDKQFPEAVPKDVIQPLFSQIEARYLASLKHTEDNLGLRIVIAEGITAAFLIELFNQEKLPHPDALVVIAPYFPQWQLNQALPKQLASLPFPILDLQPEDAVHWSQETFKHRQIQTERFSHASFRQRRIPREPHAQQPHILAHHLYGWLKYEGF